MIEATNDSQPRELVPAGNHMARCYSMVHVGTNKETIMGEDKLLNKIRVTWELPTEKRVFNEEKGAQPMVISKEYTLSSHEKSNLRKDLESWRGKAYTEDQAKKIDVTKLIGQPCLLNIIHKVSGKGKSYAMISGVTPLTHGTTCPEQENQSFEFNFDDKFDTQVVENMPDFIKDKIKSSVEYKGRIGELNQDYEETEPTQEPDEAEPLPF